MSDQNSSYENEDNLGELELALTRLGVTLEVLEHRGPDGSYDEDRNVIELLDIVRGLKELYSPNIGLAPLCGTGTRGGITNHFLRRVGLRVPNIGDQLNGTLITFALSLVNSDSRLASLNDNFGNDQVVLYSGTDENEVSLGGLIVYPPSRHSLAQTKQLILISLTPVLTRLKDQSELSALTGFKIIICMTAFGALRRVLEGELNEDLRKFAS